MVDAKEFEPTLAEFPHQSHDLLGRNHVIPNRISRDVLRRERPRDYVVLPCQNSAAFTMRLAAGMGKELAKHFAATSDGAFHPGVYKETNAQIKRRTRRDYLT